ncbi:autotransporter domain-containing protein [Mesorhizobium sp. M00.F.Ca.ET.216.01.1.1]|nr:autotransporter domain-containing protein [Mesorhizobium sp. M00.F.Ca.ET.216.01.1.1]
MGGDGAVEKLGAGATTLTGNSSAFTGTTSVNAGTLVVDGSLGDVIDVLSGARLEGSGTVGTTTIASGGTIAPGHSPGTLTVAGDIAFAAGSTYEVDITPALDGDLIAASGTATIDGGTVDVVKAAGTYVPGSRWTIIGAGGGVTGTFAALTQNMPFVDLALAYDPSHVYLDVARNDVSFCDVAQTSNQCATGDAIESSGEGNVAYDAVAAVTDEDSARAALDALSGEIHASLKGTMLEDSRFVREAALDRTRAAFSGVAVPSLPVMGYGPEGLRPQQQEALAREGKSAEVFAPAPADTDRFAVWARGFGSWGQWDSDGNAVDFERSIGGLFIGADALVAETWRLGLLTGYSRSSFDADDRTSSGSSDNYHLGLYGGTEWGNLGLRLGAAHTWHDIETGRSIAFPGFADSAQASYDARTAQAFGELGYRIASGNFALEPFANLAYVNVHTDGFTEEGGAAALTSASSDTDATFTTLGLRAATDFRLGGVTATARGMVGWRHAFGDTIPTSTYAFAGSDAFTIAGTPIAEDALVLEAGFDVGLSEKTSLGVSYSGQVASKASDHGFRAEFTVKF